MCECPPIVRKSLQNVHFICFAFYDQNISNSSIKVGFLFQLEPGIAYDFLSQSRKNPAFYRLVTVTSLLPSINWTDEDVALDLISCLVGDSLQGPRQHGFHGLGGTYDFLRFSVTEATFHTVETGTMGFKKGIISLKVIRKAVTYLLSYLIIKQNYRHQS